MAWGPHGLKLLGSGGGNFGDSNSKSTFQKVKNNTWKIRKCPVFYVDRRAKCRKRSPQKWIPPSLASWPCGFGFYAPPLPPYLSPGKSLVPLGSPTIMGLRELLRTAPYNKVIIFNSLGSFFIFSQRKFLITLHYLVFKPHTSSSLHPVMESLQPSLSHIQPFLIPSTIWYGNIAIAPLFFTIINELCNKLSV